MEGWVKFDLNTFESDLTELASKFSNISFIIDELLAERKK